MIHAVKYSHTNLIAREWRSLAEFYREVFGCIPVPPERHYAAGGDLARGTGVAESELHGVHLLLPGYGPDSPTLEIYSYTVSREAVTPAVNRPGLGHIAFSVADVAQARNEVLARGGAAVGEIVTLRTSDRRRVTWCYVRDPEGNIIELQSWET
ncbi:MAG TPA: VOC family protein [Bacteroidota bacterium]|nr:VOC family protein [Bacteroidota bacterium]